MKLQINKKYKVNKTALLKVGMKRTVAEISDKVTFIGNYVDGSEFIKVRTESGRNLVFLPEYLIPINKCINEL